MPSSYSTYLPTALQNDPIIDGFLQAFETILSGSTPDNKPSIITQQSHPPGLEAVTSIIYQYFDPDQTPEDFLPWLASWVGLSLWDEWDVKVKRSFIRQIVPLYQKRGTKEGLSGMLKLYLNSPKEEVNIYEFDQPAHYFQVQLTLGNQNLQEYRRKERIARAIIDQEKPAHTFYSFQILMPTMQIFKSADTAKAKGSVMLKLGGEESYGNRTILGNRSARDISQEKESTSTNSNSTTTQ
ncbi:phage tail protein I [Nostoc parmelioides]|nr:phage tail protein I [Nostoc parmelioides]